MRFSVVRLQSSVREESNKRRFAGRGDSLAVGAHALDQPSEHAPNVDGGSLKVFGLLLREQAKVTREDDEILQLACGTCGDIEELAQFGISPATAAFGDVGGNGSGAPAHLCRQTVSLRLRERSGRTVDTQSQCVTLSPYLKLPKILQGTAPISLVYYPYGSITTSNPDLVRAASPRLTSISRTPLLRTTEHCERETPAEQKNVY